MIGINLVSSYIPQTTLSNIEQAAKYEKDKEYLKKNIGAYRLPVKEPKTDTSDLACQAVNSLINKADIAIDEVDALVVVTQNPDGYGLPHTSAIVHKKLNMGKHIAAFDISLGCSGYVYGLSILKGLMKEASLKNGILVSCDPYSKIINREDRTTSLLFGDAATATLLNQGGKWKIGTPLLQTNGSEYKNLIVQEGFLEMNGRQVFNFTLKEVPAQINQYLRINGLEETDIDYYCLHQGSASIVTSIARKYPKVRERFLLDMENTGNTISSSIPLLIEKYILPSEATKVLICGFGVGLSWATNLLTKEKQK